MDNNFSKSFFEKLEEIYEKEDGNIKNYKVEKPNIENILNKIEIHNSFKDIYEFIEPIARGGSGIIIKIKEKRLNLLRALKIPRPKDEKYMDTVRNEINYLTKLEHDNLIKIHNLGEICIGGLRYPHPFFIMDYIKSGKDLRERVLEILEYCDNSRKLKDITFWVAKIFLRLAEAIRYLHYNSIIHFDIKPNNILIDKNDKPILSDLGFAKKKSSSKVPVVVGFTYFYAHPKLKELYYKLSSLNRVRKQIPPVDFKYIHDVYAYGKSLLEILSLIDWKFPDSVHYDYNFIYLHLSACRMLDGLNFDENQVERIKTEQLHLKDDVTVFKENWLSLHATDFEQIKYNSFDEIYKDLKKLLSGGLFNDSIPELNPSYPKRIQSSKGDSAPFSYRTKCIIEHPVVSRLSSVPQLGLISKIYPTATHNRLEHTIGVFRNCILYIQSLYNDPFNPLFKQLINEDDIKCILLSSILHDIGQYPLAHEIEEVMKDIRHEVIGLQLLDCEIKDCFKRTLKNIIVNKEWGWGIELNKVKNILNASCKLDLESDKDSLKTKMLVSIINGPIDCDKLDYLLRDSQNCFLNYGDIIDFDRLVRNLTIILYEEKNHKKLSIGTYEKGQSAAETLTFARYLLYQVLYWHHTSRAIRIMLKESIKQALEFSKNNKNKTNEFLEKFISFINMNIKSNNLTIDNILNFIEKNNSICGEKLIKMIKNRNYYKRILTIHSYPSNGNGEEEEKEKFIDKFRTESEKNDFQVKLQDKIFKEFLNITTSIIKPKTSMLSNERIEKVSYILSQPKTILCDCPKLVPGAKEKLRFIPEPKKIFRNYFIRSEVGESVSEVWNTVFYRLMNIASKGRIYCHPNIRDSIMAALGPEGLKKCLEQVIETY